MKTLRRILLAVAAAAVTCLMAGSCGVSKIKDIKISPAGGNKAKYDLKTEPCDPPELPKQESRYSNKGFGLSFDLKADKQTKRNIRKLVDQF